MTANCTRCCGRHATVAPESSSTAGRRRVGMMVARAGRLMPGTRPKAAWAAITDAPVCPALKSAAARPCATASAASRIDARGLRRSAAAAGSSMPIASGVSRISRGSAPAPGCRAISRSMTSRSPTSSSPSAGAGRPPAPRPRCCRGRRRPPSRQWRCAWRRGTGRRTPGGHCTGDLRFLDRADRTALCSSRSAGRRGAAPSPRGTADRCRSARGTARRAYGAWPSASWNAGVWDWARSSSPCRGSAASSAAQGEGRPTRACTRTWCGSGSPRSRGTGRGTTRRTTASSAAPVETARAASRSRRAFPRGRTTSSDRPRRSPARRPRRPAAGT